MSMNQTNKISKRCLALITALSLILTMVVVAVGTIQWPEKLVGFEKSDLAYSQWTALGSTEVDLTLPETLRAMVSIPNEMDVSTFQQATPLGDVSTGDLMYDYYNYGYVVCAEAEEKYAAGEKVIYSVYYAGEDGGVASVGYRLYGSLEGTGDLWFVCDANGNIQYGIIDVPVIWSGAYDGNTLGTYTYTCEVSPSSTYGYNGTMPTAEIYVGDPESEAYSCSHSTEDGVCEDCVYDAYNTLQASRIAYSTETTNETAEYTQNLEDYMTANIATVKNSGGTGVTEGIITGPWVDYLNTLWHNRVKTMVWTGEGEVIPWNTAWTPSAVLWDGTRAYSNDHDADWGAIYYPDYDSTTKTYTVYYGSQLLYAMEACHNNPGATISIMSDINLNGENYAWPGVELTTSVTIEGNGHTIYNLCSFTDQSDTTKGFATFVQGTGVEFTVKDLHFETGLLVCSMTSNGTSDVPDLGTSDAANISLFRWKGYNTESSFTLDNVTANGFIACSVGSCVSVLIDMFYSGNANDTECYNTITNCAVSNSYIYGMDHIGALGSYTSNVAFTNCYSINNTLVGYGYHSGAFVSCLNNRSTFDSCFSANNYMYSAMYAGGFTGFAGDGADYTNCYSSGKVEGFLYVGGFTGSADAGYQSVAEPYNETITRNYCTFTNCYSTALVGIRTETSYSGGFIGRVEYAYDRYPNGQNIFTNCYAAGEVGNTSTDLNTNEKVVGGFIGWDDTLGTDYESVYINCYYDKQTTAMREWVTGYYDTSTVDTSGLNGNLTNGITGVLTTDTEKSGAGLTDTPSNEGFVGFTNNFDQIQAIVDKNSAAYTLKVSEYVGAPLDLGTVDDVKWVYTDEYYPQLSIFSDANNNTSAWGDLDTQLIEDFSLASVTTVLLDTWDTGYDWTEGVRTDEKVQYDRPNQGDHKGDEYTYDTVREIISDGEITSGAGKFAKLSDGTIYISVGDEITSNPITIDETADTLAVNSSGVDWYNITQGIGARPIRLVTFMNVYAGEDQTVENGALYDHRKDVELTMMDELQDNLILGIDDFDSEVMWATAEVMGFPSEKEDYLNNETNFFEAYTNETDFSASQEAWLNTEVWLAEPVTDDTNTTGKTIYYGENDTAYVEGLAVKLAGYTLEPDEDTPLTTTQSQWTGSIPLATDDLKYDQTYIVAYYWLLADGRYRTDYKIVTVEPEEKEYDVTIQVFNENDDLLEDETYTTNEEAMMLGADLIDNTVSVTSHTVEIDFVEDVEESTETYVAWNHYDPAYRVTRTELIMTNNADFVVGYVETLGDLAEGDQITIPITTYYTQTGEATYEYVYTEVLNDGDSVSSQDQDITYTYQDTMAYTTTDQYTYTVEKDANGNLYLAFDKGVQVVITEDGEEETVLTIQDISYNITFNIYVEEIATVDVTKVVSNYNANMKDQSFIINLDGDYDTQVDLNHNETSKPVITVMQDGETRILTVSETVPMEFTLTGITYTVESYDLVDGVNVYNKSEPAALDAGEELIVNAGDMVHITFTNTYASQGYFKDRAEKANVFTNQ